MEPETGQRYARVSWAELKRTVTALAEAIRPSMFGPLYPTTIVSIGRGGLVPARILADELGIRRFAYVGVEARRSPEGVRIEANWNDVAAIRALRIPLHQILFVDDIADSGSTVAFIHDRFRDGTDYSPVATVFTRLPIGTGKQSPDYAGRILDPRGPLAKAWIVFPYEERESAALFRDGVEVPLG